MNGYNATGNIRNSKGEIVSKRYDLISKNGYTFPNLYIETRKQINNIYGRINGGSADMAAYLAKKVAEKYNIGLSTDIYFSLLLNNKKAQNSIDKGYPFLWGTYADTYDNHLMMGCGYKTYSKTTKIWRFSYTKYKTFYEVKDGWNTESKYFDVSGYYFVGATIIFKYAGVAY